MVPIWSVPLSRVAPAPAHTSRELVARRWAAPMRWAPIHKIGLSLPSTRRSTGTPSKVPVAAQAFFGQVRRTLLDGATGEGSRVVVEGEPPAERSIRQRIEHCRDPAAVALREYRAQHRVDHGTADNCRGGNERNEQSKDDRDAHGFG